MVTQCEAVIVSVPPLPIGCFACEKIQNDDASAELIPKPPFVSITLAPAAMRHGGTDTWTIDDLFIYLFQSLDDPDPGPHVTASLFPVLHFFVEVYS